MTAADQVRRVRNSGSFELPLPPDQAFPLFTADGERKWVPGWSPTVLGPEPQHTGLVFLTQSHGLDTIWTVIESDPAKRRHLYSRVTPGASAGTVEVCVRPAPQGSIVDVAYDLTALSEEGAAGLDSYEGEQFGAMMDKWRSLITDMLARGA